MISEQTRIKGNRLLATIRKLAKQYSLHMEYMLTESFPTNDWYNMYHATISRNSDVYGSRIPGIWIKHVNGTIHTHVHFAIDENMGHSFDSPTTSIHLNKWIPIIISQIKVGGDYYFKFETNGKVIYTKKNTKPRQYENVKIYISNPWYPPVPGYVRNVCLKGKV